MGLGRKKRRQDSLWIAMQELPRTSGHVFYERVNRILEENGFDRFVEDARQKFYAPVMGRPGVVPGVPHTASKPSSFFLIAATPVQRQSKFLPRNFDSH